LNTARVFLLSLELVDSFPSSVIHGDLADAPSLDEIRNPFSLLAGNKAGGINGILPEMVKVCSNELLTRLFDLFICIWDSGSVPQEWRNASLVPVPKKGDLPSCDNWQGISQLDVVSFAKIIH